MPHKSVLLKETIGSLSLKPGQVVIDGTLGGGGHAEAILNGVGPTGRLIGFDQDPEAIQRCKQKFEGVQNVEIIQENFRNMYPVVQKLHLKKIDAVLLDIGLSSFQLDDAERGFSFKSDAPLDMRMNPDQGITAAELIQGTDEKELADILYYYADERRSRKIATAIVERRRQKRIETTCDLADVVEEAIYGPQRKSKHAGRGTFKGKTHPATKTFQALRIAVNDELHALEEGLKASWETLSGGGRLAVISFHSGEDRMVKNYFKELVVEGAGVLVHKKPISPEYSEVKENRRARSAKLRVIQKNER